MKLNFDTTNYWWNRTLKGGSINKKLKLKLYYKSLVNTCLPIISHFSNNYGNGKSKNFFKESIAMADYENDKTTGNWGLDSFSRENSIYRGMYGFCIYKLERRNLGLKSRSKRSIINNDYTYTL